MKRISTVKGVLIGASLLMAATLFEACKHEPVNPVAPGTPGTPIDPITPPPPPPPENPCVPGVVYFQTDVLPILISNCTFSGCHNTTDRAEGFDLTSYASVMGADIVEPNDLDGSDMYEAITEDDPDKIMPRPPYPQLTQAQKNIIRNWIQQGAQNLTCNSCDTSAANVKYSTLIAPLVENSCKGCHSGGSPSGGINLTTHAGVQQVALNNKLMPAITHTVPQLSKRMPQNGPKLSDCMISKIRIWVEAGAPNN